MKQLLLIAGLLSSIQSFSQLNISQLGYVDVPLAHTTVCNDIWGYEDENNNEYALVGTEHGVSIVDVTDPSVAAEIEWIDGLYSVWRDIKVYGDYAYVTTEAEEGLMIIDLSPLPSSTTLPFTHYSGPSGDEWLSAHNVYQDNGFVYIFGAGRGIGGVIILDVATDPLNPIEVGTFDNWYAHDGYVLNDTGYFAHINDGFFSIVDLTDKANPVLLGTSSTPSIFTHNIWTTADGDFAFTTDEVNGGYLAAYDVSDPANIQYLDKIQSSPNENIMPHNAHVLGDYLITSYYADGIVVHDISNPANMVEVGNFDTSPLDESGSVGCWGAYPFLSSGNILATDRQEGLFILGPTYQQGAYLEGNVTEFGTSTALNNVGVSIDNESIYDNTNIFGDYATGIASTGTYDVTFFKILYYPETVSVNLTQGTTVVEDVELTKIPQYNVTVTVLDAVTLNPIENAQVLFEHTYLDHQGVTDVNGEVVLGLYYEDNYDVVAGKWGFQSDCFSDTLLTNSTTDITLYLDQGIYDDFSLDFGWAVFGDADKGMWEREAPVGVNYNGEIENPFTDALWDCGNKAFITGNGTTAGNTEEVADGETTLISPIFDLTAYATPHVNFNVFYYNQHGPFYPNDTLFVKLFNGTETIDLTKIHVDNIPLSTWTPMSVEIPLSFNLTANMQVILTISDYLETINITEAAFDHFSITDFSMAGKAEDELVEIEAYPNPFADIISINGVSEGTFKLYAMDGQLIEQGQIAKQLNFDYLAKGAYLLAAFNQNGELKRTIKLMKQ
ncbi:MAG: choice-of-anchor B family protein [Crocinitomicaceae bacterium]